MVTGTPEHGVCVCVRSRARTWRDPTSQPREQRLRPLGNALRAAALVTAELGLQTPPGRVATPAGSQQSAAASRADSSVVSHPGPLF